MNELALQMAIATLVGPVVAWRFPRLRISWQLGLAAYTVGVVFSHLGPLRASFAGPERAPKLMPFHSAHSRPPAPRPQKATSLARTVTRNPG